MARLLMALEPLFPTALVWVQEESGAGLSGQGLEQALGRVRLSWVPLLAQLGPAWGNPVAGRESERPRTPDSRPHQRWCYCLVENVNPL